MNELDLRGPFDELRELREMLTTQQIAELTGLRRETISRARPDGRFQQRTEKALGDLYAVSVRIRAAQGGDVGQLAAVLRRSQPLLGGRSIAELLKEGRVDLVFEYLGAPDPAEVEQLENIQLDPAIEAELRDLESAEPDDSVDAEGDAEQRVRDLIAGDPGLASCLPAVEKGIRDEFGADVRINRAVVVDHTVPDGREYLYLRLRSDRPFGEELDRLVDFFEREERLLAPVQDRLSIGNL